MSARTLTSSAIQGSVRFGAASVLVYATVAFGERWMYQTLGYYGAYLVWTLLFIGLGGAALQGLATPANRGAKLFAAFGIGFLLYAAGWCGAYFTLRGGLGEWIGSLAGSVLLGTTLAFALDARRQATKACLILFAANSIGYFLGSVANSEIGGQVGMLAWGLLYGLGLGAGLGASLHLTQLAPLPNDKPPT